MKTIKVYKCNLEVAEIRFPTFKTCQKLKSVFNYKTKYCWVIEKETKKKTLIVFDDKADFNNENYEFVPCPFSDEIYCVLMDYMLPRPTCNLKINDDCISYFDGESYLFMEKIKNNKKAEAFAKFYFQVKNAQNKS